ncbi:MAG: ribonuclease D [Deltaproteobacteria bacterium]|nr:MAG: ribonuclease D [Deltaproteobacteria bacterium]
MFGDTPLVMIEDDAGLASLCEELSQRDTIAVDTESDSFHHYQEKVCLIQISDLDRDYIVDPLQITDMGPLKALFEDGRVRKLLHGADYDIVCLKRDYDIALNNIFDTMIAAQFLAFPKIGLADLIDHFFGIRLEKKYQRHDWSQRPLEPEHLLYARGDTHWLLAVAEVLEYKLARAGWLDAVLEECAVLQTREWSGRTAHASDFLRVKQASTLDDEGKRVLRALWEYRDEQARRMDRPAFKVLPGHTLIDIARARPRDLDALAGVVRERSSAYRRHGKALVEAVLAGLADERPIPSPPRSPSRGGRTQARADDHLLGLLKAWRNDLVEREGVAPVVVANNQLLKDIATVAPTDIETLRTVPGIRRWQVDAYGDAIIELVRAANQRASDDKPRRRRRRRRRRSSGDQGE